MDIKLEDLGNQNQGHGGTYVNGGFILPELSVNPFMVFDYNIKQLNNVSVVPNLNKKEQPSPSDSWKIFKNLVVLSIASMVFSTAHLGNIHLYDSLDKSEGVEVISSIVLLICVILSASLLAVFVIYWLGCKSSIIISILFSIPYIAVQCYPRMYTVIPCAFIFGILRGLLTVAQYLYVSTLGNMYAEYAKQKTDEVLPKFFGIFFMMVHSSQIWEHLLSFSVFFHGNSKNARMEEGDRNSSGTFEQDFTLSHFPRPANSKIYAASSIYVVCVVLSAMIVALSLDPIKTFRQSHANDNGKTTLRFELVMKTISLLRSHTQLLLIPLTLYYGMHTNFIAGEFMEIFEVDHLAMSLRCYIMVCFGTTCSVAALALSCAVKVTGRLIVLMLAAAIHLSLIITLIAWTPNRDPYQAMFLLAGLWGIGSGVLSFHLSSTYALLFPDREDASFGSLTAWEAVGLLLSYGCRSLLPPGGQLCVLLSLLVIGLVAYVAAEYLEHKMFTYQYDVTKINVIKRRKFF